MGCCVAVQVYPTTVLTVARDLESTLTPPEVSVLLLLEPSLQKTKRRRKGNAFFDVLQKVLGRGDDSQETETSGQQQPTAAAGAAATAAAAATDPAAAAAAADGQGSRAGKGAGAPTTAGAGGGAAAAEAAAVAAAAAAAESPETAKDYRKKLDGIRSWSPGVYMRVDSQLFRTLHAPDMRLLLHSCAGIVVVVSPQRCLLVLGESLNLVDTARTKDLLMSSNIQVHYLTLILLTGRRHLL